MIFTSNPVRIFLEKFNKIDKYFDIVLENNKFMPFNAKIKEIINGNYPISIYVKIHNENLKHLGELRNEFVHGKKVKGKNRIVPTKEAITELKKHQKAICNPPTCQELFNKKPERLDISIKIENKINKIINIFDMTKQQYFPIYDNKKFMGITTIYNMLNSQKNNSDYIGHNYSFIHDSASIYTVEDIFYQHYKQYKNAGVIFLTKNGKKDEEITGYITADHLPLITKYLIK